MCCFFLICDCFKLKILKCFLSWYYDCCLVKFCFIGDILVYIVNGMVFIEKIEEGDLVIVCYEDDVFVISYLCCVD